jgi:hypothetical protein
MTVQRYNVRPDERLWLAQDGAMVKMVHPAFLEDDRLETAYKELCEAAQEMLASSV